MNIYYKTRMCRSVDNGRSCPYANKCIFAHSIQELNPSVSERFRVCKNYSRGGYCEYGAGCIYKHGDVDYTQQLLLFNYLNLGREHRLPIFVWLSTSEWISSRAKQREDRENSFK